MQVKSVLTFLGRKKSSVGNPLSKKADIERWSAPTNLSVDWDKRAELAANWIPPSSILMDIGCGRMAVEKFAAPLRYIPVDIVSRDERTIVVDLNEGSIPIETIKQVNFVTMLGVLEYLEQPDKLLSMLASNGIKAVCSYQLSEYSSPDVRSGNGWFNSYTALEFAGILNKSGYRIIESKKVDTQGLYLLEPVSFQKESQVSKESTNVSLKTAKPKLVLSGFFGRGNTGDEAVLQAEYEHLSKDFDIIISVEQHGAHAGFWNWYPYNQCQIIGHEDLGIFRDPNVVGLHVGGGDLPIGFNASQIVAALAAGKLVQSSGVDIGTTFDSARIHNPAMLSTYLEWTKPWVRSKVGCEILNSTSERAQHGADWALGLRADRASDVSSENCLLVLREFPKSRLTSEIRSELCSLVQTISEKFGTPTLLPFCPEDERFLDDLESVWGLPRQVHWWNPGRIKQYIAQAKMVISVGRFHPIVFAACTNTPAYFCEWGLEKARSQDDLSVTPKSKRVCQETGIGYYADLASLTTDLQKSQVVPVPKGFDSLYLKRFELMKQEVTRGYLNAAERSS